ncbi:MAG: class I SAM-dependent DNA methyltransferase [Actinomycetota bacterium]
MGMIVKSDPNGLRRTFDVAAETYDSARPDYPAELYRDLIDLSGVQSDARMLEIGCGSGKATRPFAERGFHITCIELGDRLAEVARRNLSSFPKVEVVTSSFEDWEGGDLRFDLIYAATSWHWISKAIRYEKAAKLLDPQGHFAFWSATHAFPSGFDPFFSEIQEVYDAIGESNEGDWPPQTPEETPDQTAEIEASGFFEVMGVRRYVWANRDIAKCCGSLLH